MPLDAKDHHRPPNFLLFSFQQIRHLTYTSGPIWNIYEGLSHADLG